MSDFDINFPAWINYGKGDRENKIGDKMNELVTATWSPFNGCDIAQVFIFCMAYAAAKGRIPQKPPGSSGSMPGSAFKKDMRDFMKVVAITHTNKLEVTTDPKEVVKIAEGFAYASFLEVYDKIQQGIKNGITSKNILDAFLQDMISQNES